MLKFASFHFYLKQRKATLQKAMLYLIPFVAFMTPSRNPRNPLISENAKTAGYAGFVLSKSLE